VQGIIHTGREATLSDSADLTTPSTRRAFFRKGAAVAVSLPAVATTLTACAETKASPAPADSTRVATPPPPTPREKADAMDAMHEKGVKAFPAKTAGKGNQPLAPRMEGGVKVFDLVAEEIQWEVEPGRKVKAWAYNGQVPGPQIRVREGDRVRINLHNKLNDSTAIHYHGLELPNDQDGVPFITQPPVKPGERYTYEFTVPNAGSHMYHSHHNAAIQFSLGVLLYELAAGERPFRGDSSPALMSSILKDHPRPIDEWRADVPADVSRLIERCLEKEPRDRIQTAAEMLVELKAQRRAWESGAGGSARRLVPDGVLGPAEPAASIAVLAFSDMSAAKDQDWFCEGIAEEILNALSPLEGLRVAARTSAFSFKGKGDDLRTIGQKLNVTTVLEGSVRRAGDRVRITVQLSDVANGFQLWSERYDRELKDIFDVQDEIAKATAERLRVTLTGGKGGRLVEQATTNVQAYQLYLQGRALVDRRGASVPAGLNLLRQAVALDPAYSLAWAGIADALTVLAYSGAAPGSASKPEAMAAARRSIALDPTSAVGHTALACATLLYENNRAMAKQEFERALELNPGYGMGRCWYANYYLSWALGDFEHGIAEARHALANDPLSAYVTMSLGIALLTAGRLDEAIDTCRRAMQLDPESFVSRWALGIALGMAGRSAEAVSTLEAAAVMSGRHSLALTSLAGVFGQDGKPAEALALHREMIDRASRIYVSPTHLALTAEAAGHHEEAIAFARRAWDEREPSFILWARHFPQYRTLHRDPRFAAILREMDRPEETENAPS
jgi:serine/threonine-protein kinase